MTPTSEAPSLLASLILAVEGVAGWSRSTGAELSGSRIDTASRLGSPPWRIRESLRKWTCSSSAAWCEAQATGSDSQTHRPCRTQLCPPSAPSFFHGPLHPNGQPYEGCTVQIALDMFQFGPVPSAEIAQNASWKGAWDTDPDGLRHTSLSALPTGYLTAASQQKPPMSWDRPAHHSFSRPVEQCTERTDRIRASGPKRLRICEWTEGPSSRSTAMSAVRLHVH